jgi:hypothetical protein
VLPEGVPRGWVQDASRPGEALQRREGTRHHRQLHPESPESLEAHARAEPNGPRRRLTTRDVRLRSCGASGSAAP